MLRQKRTSKNKNQPLYRRDQFLKFISLSIFFVLLAVILIGFLWYKSRVLIHIDSRLAIPENTVAFIEINKITDFINDLDSENNIWKELKNIDQLKHLNLTIHEADSIFKKSNQFSELLSKKFTISITLKSNRNPGILFIIPLSVKNQKDLIIEGFRTYTKNFKYSKRRYNSQIIYDLNWSDTNGNKTFSFVISRGMVIGSFSGELVEESLRAITSDNHFKHKSEFKAVAGTIGQKVQANIFINYKKLPELIEFLSAKDKFEESGFVDFAEWGALDAEILPDKLILNGFISTKDSLPGELNLFKGQEAISFSSPAFLPSEISYFKLYGFSDLNLFFKQLDKNFENNKTTDLLKARELAAKEKYNIELRSSIKDLIEREYGLANLKEGRIDYEYFFMKVKSHSLAEETFKKWVKEFASKNGLSSHLLISNVQLDNNNRSEVYNLPIGGIPSIVFGNAFESVNKDYFTFINNFIVFSNSVEALKYLIYQVNLGNTLSEHPAYISITDYISSLSNYFIYVKPLPSLEKISSLLNHNVGETIKFSRDKLNKIDAIAIQYSSSDELFYNRIFINYSDKENMNVNTVWESRIDSTINFKPVILINHITGEKEIFIQDNYNQIYLISNAGLILWKQKIDGPIISEVNQVEYYKNRKFQYLFNTANKIYLIDRNGNPVEKFPVELRSKATAGMSLFDYDKDEVLRICIPCEDKRIYMYDKEGNVIPGWKPDKTDNIIDRPLQHFRIKNNDYIIGIDKFKFYILDRQGKIRIRPSKYFPVSSNNSFYLNQNKNKNSEGFITTDTAGSLMKIKLNGNVETLIKQSLPKEHYFINTDLDGDRMDDYIFTAGSEFFVTNERGTKKFSKELPGKIKIKPIIYNFAATENKVGIVFIEEGNIYLYNNDGSLYKGFPLKGTSLFSISSFPELKGKFNLVVGGKNNFLYNYSVQ